jgi:hypothetical protein
MNQLRKKPRISSGDFPSQSCLQILEGYAALKEDEHGFLTIEVAAFSFHNPMVRVDSFRDICL